MVLTGLPSPQNQKDGGRDKQLIIGILHLRKKYFKIQYRNVDCHYN